MEVTVDSTGRLERRVRVEIPEDRIASEVQSRLQRLCKTARMDGFRPGRVPFSVINRRFGPQVRQEVVGDVVRRSFTEAVAQQNLRPAGAPVIDPLEADPGNGLKYTATFEVMPELGLAPFTELELERRVCKIEESDIDAMIERLRRQHRHWHGVERPAQSGDRITIDFEGRVGGAPFQGGSARDFHVEIGSQTLLPGFEDALIGAEAGTERAFDLTVPAEYRNRDLAGKPVTFTVKVQTVEEPHLPDVDEAFCAELGVAEGGLARFREEVKKNLERERDQALRRELRARVLDALAKANQVELPKVMVDNEAARLLHELKHRMARRGLPREQVDALTPDVVIEQARRRVQLGLIMNETVKRAGLKVNPVAVRTEVERIASTFEDPARVVRWYYEDPERLSEIEAACLEDEVVQWVAGQARVVEKNVAFDALMHTGGSQENGKGDE
jgi:trigger factor